MAAECFASQPTTKKTASAAATSVTGASSHPQSSSLLDGPLDKMMADPWSSPARPAASASHWDEPIDTATHRQPEMWSSRRSPSPGLSISQSLIAAL